MGKIAQIVIGPAGSGKTTYCRTMFDHIQSLNSNPKNRQKRHVHFVNLDPAIDDPLDDSQKDTNIYTFSITDLITLQDVMEEMELGPNGALLYCMEFFISQMDDWLSDILQDFNDDYLIFDCPGQVELYSHVPLMKQFANELIKLGYRVTTVYCMDAQFTHDPTKFMSGTLMALSAMTLFQDCPHFNVLTKVDIVKEQLKQPNDESPDIHELLEEYLNPDTDSLLYRMKQMNSSFSGNQKLIGLHSALAKVVSEFSLVSFIPFDISDEDSIEYTLSSIDHAVQYGEDAEPQDPYEEQEDDDDVDNGEDLLAQMYNQQFTL